MNAANTSSSHRRRVTVTLRGVPLALRVATLIAALALALLATWSATPSVRHPTGHASGVGPLLQSAAAWVLLGALAWGLVVSLALVLELLSHGHVPALGAVGCPRALRAALLAGCGVGLAAAPTYAVGGGSGLDGLPLPERPDGQLTTTAQPIATQAGPHRAEVVVRAGDSLWSIARSTGTGPTAETVSRLYAANRSVIGDDPDLIVPGQRLVLPQQRPTAGDVR